MYRLRLHVFFRSKPTCCALALLTLLCLSTFVLLLKLNPNIEFYDNEELVLRCFKLAPIQRSPSTKLTHFPNQQTFPTNPTSTPTHQTNTSLLHAPICDYDGYGIDLMVIVFTSPKNAPSRAAIRDTWGRLIVERGGYLFFLLGTSQQEDTVQRQIEAESEQYSDIIQADLPDDSFPMFKSITMLKFITENCSRVRYVFKTVDTAFINSQQLTDYCETTYKNQRTILGNLAAKWSTPRSPENPYFLPIAFYKSTQLPNFILGPNYLFYADAARHLLRVAISESKSGVAVAEDLFITGLVAEKARVKRKQEKRLANNGKLHIDQCNFASIWISLGHGPEVMRQLWELVWSRKCSVSKPTMRRKAGK